MFESGFLAEALLTPLVSDSVAAAFHPIHVANGIVSVLQLVVVVGLLYYYALLLASTRPTRKEVQETDQNHRSFAIAIPAHNEEAVLAHTIRQIQSMHYPAGQFDIHVVADHCKDETAQIATASGAICHERNEEPRGRKAYALQWLLERIIASEKAYDAIIVFDADSHVDPDFLLHMDQALSSGRPVWQGKHVILDPQKSHYSGLADVDMRINNLLRNQARERLGLSCRLMGDAMCFSTAVIREYGWPAESLGEDREYGLYLLTQGIRIGFAPDAISSGQAAPGWKDATSQRVRWYGGVFQIQKEFGVKLLHLWLRKGNWAAFDQALELWLPPISTLFLLSVGLAIVPALWRSLDPLLSLPASIGLAVAWIAFPFLGLWADSAPLSAYRALLYGPFYLVWRLWIGMQARTRGKRVRWIRTRRSEEIASAPPKG